MGEENVTVEEAQELWIMMQDELEEVMSMDQGKSGSGNGLEEMTRHLQQFDPSTHTVEKHLEMFDKDFMENMVSGGSRLSDASTDIDGSLNEGRTSQREPQDFSQMIADLKNDWRDQGVSLDKYDTFENTNSDIPPPSVQKSHQLLGQTTQLTAIETTPARQLFANPTTASTVLTASYNPDSYSAQSRDDFMGELSIQSLGTPAEVSQTFAAELEVVRYSEREEDPKLKELRDLLPALSDQRLKRILKVFKRNLGNPTLLDLVPIVRENMPDYITNTWLKKMSSLTANYVVQIAAEEHMVDRHILNGVLQIETSHGSLDRALDFHQSEFSRHEIQQTNYSDRLVLQMFTSNNRLGRALSFKQNVEASGRALDLKAYGSLIEYCSRRKQIGSALLLLKECIRVHGAPPGEAALRHFRLLCRENDVTEKFCLKELIGDDPLEWIREGKKRKQDRSKETLRKAKEARDLMVRV